LRKAIERIHACMKLGLSCDQTLYDEELGKLVDEFGVDFVCRHACEETWHSVEACPPGHCERPDGHGVVDPEDGEYTCRQACRAYIEFAMGRPPAN
jgi:hypothetical protein